MNLCQMQSRPWIQICPNLSQQLPGEVHELEKCAHIEQHSGTEGLPAYSTSEICHQCRTISHSLPIASTSSGDAPTIWMKHNCFVEQSTEQQEFMCAQQAGEFGCFLPFCFTLARSPMSCFLYTRFSLWISVATLSCRRWHAWSTECNRNTPVTSWPRHVLTEFFR